MYQSKRYKDFYNQIQIKPDIAISLSLIKKWNEKYVLKPEPQGKMLNDHFRSRWKQFVDEQEK